MNVQRFMCSAAVAATLALVSSAVAGSDTVTLTANACYKVGDTVIVAINKDVTGTAVAGGQFFLSYDTSKLTYVSGAAGDAPFTTTIWSASGAGTVDFAVGVPLPANATTAAGVMARLTFTASNEICAGSNLVTFRTPPNPFPPSRLTDVLGAAVPATFGDLGALTIDSTLPVIGYCPPNITINCDVAPTPANTLGPATATDNCGVPVVTFSDSTITSVTPSNLGDWNLFATGQLTNTPGGDGTADFVNGPASPPLGTGSAHLNTGSLGDQSAQMRNDAWAGTLLSALTELGYSTYGTSWNGPMIGSGGQMTYLTLYIDLDGDLVYDDRLFFEPEYSQAGYMNPNNPTPQPGPVLGVWQTWNCMTGMWYGDTFAGPGVDARPLSWYITAHPTARIINANPTQGGIRIAAGFASPTDVFNVYVDNFRIATSSSSAVYNFELSGFPCSDEIITRTWKATDCAGNFSTCSQTITRHDSTAPVITCPPNVTANADAGGCSAAASSILGNEWQVFGDGSVVTLPSTSNMVGEMPSTAAGTNHYSGVAYVPTSPFLFSGLSTLSLDYAMVQGCFGGGSPRIYVGIDTTSDGIADGYVFVYIGTLPNYTDCPTIGAWSNTGNLVTDPGLRWDTGQFPGGTFYDSHAHAVALVGGNDVVEIGFVMDGSWLADQNIRIDNFQINSAVQSFNTPSATDNCSGPADITLGGVRSDMLPLSAPYPSGTTTITWTATDCAGNSSSCNQTIMVNPVNVLNATVELANVNLTTFDRCITFQFSDTSACPSAPVTVSTVMTFTNRVATAAIPIPCGGYDCVTATDALHTLRMTANPGHFGISGITYFADFINDVNGDDRLPGGNLNNDAYVDILDFGAFIGQLGVVYGSVNTTCSTLPPHADINGDGTVNGLDYSFISTNFLDFREVDCCGNTLLGDGGPITDITVFALGERDWDMARVADVNRDGRVNLDDVVFVAANGKGACPADYDNRNGVAIDDLFLFINGYFAGHPAADMNADRSVQIDDLFLYVNDWFVGCN